MNCKLILTDADGDKTFQLKSGENVIGRDSNSTIQIIAEGASRAHAQILVEDDTVTIKDLDSANGTYINDKKTSHVQLKHGDEIVIAGQHMRFEMDKVQEAETQSYSPKVTSDRSVYATVKMKAVPNTKSKDIISDNSNADDPEQGKPGFFKKLFKK